MRRMQLTLAAALSLAVTTPAVPQTDYTTPAGAREIHGYIAATIISFREEGDVDHIYFTAILGWRCGMKQLFYSLNDDPTEIEFPLEPCYRDLRTPNAFDPEVASPISITVPTGSVQKITLRAVYDDGETATFTSDRKSNLIM